MIIFRPMEKYYRHFKGGLYRLVGIAKDSETLEDLVVYQALYGDHQLWVRPKAMFFGQVERDGKVFERFQEVPELEALIEEGEASGYLEKFDFEAHLEELKKKRGE